MLAIRVIGEAVKDGRYGRIAAVLEFDLEHGAVIVGAACDRGAEQIAGGVHEQPADLEASVAAVLQRIVLPLKLAIVVGVAA